MVAPATRGMTETPVSKPLMPSASLGKISADAINNIVQSPCMRSSLSQAWIQVRIFDRVLCCVSSRKSHRDDEIRSRKTKQHEHEKFARPAGQKIFQHRDGTLPGVGARSDLGIDRQRSKQRDRNQNARR